MNLDLNLDLNACRFEFDSRKFNSRQKWNNDQV